MVASLKRLELFADKVNWAVYRQNKRLLVYEPDFNKMTEAHVPGVITFSKGLL